MWKRKLEAEAVKVVKFLWKRKYVDERDWKRKRTRKHITSRRAGSGSIKNLAASTSLLYGIHLISGGTQSEFSVFVPLNKLSF